jgi:hypothetical protein
MGENSKYHDPLSDALGVDNKIVVPEEKTAVVKRKTLPEPQLFNDAPVDNNNTSEEITIVPEEESIRDAKKDYAMVRGRLHQLAETGQEALEGILQVAQESEHPRAYEVVAQLIKTLADNSKQLMELHHDTQDLEDKKNAKRDKGKKTEEASTENSSNVTNNSIFVGSTAELQKMLEEMGGGKK